jgi:hypothetical protein
VLKRANKHVLMAARRYNFNGATLRKLVKFTRKKPTTIALEMSKLEENLLVFIKTLKYGLDTLILSHPKF